MPPSRPQFRVVAVAALLGVLPCRALPAQQPTQFVARTTAQPLPNLREAAAADFDGDGDIDLCASGSLFAPRAQLLLRNDGTEQFTDVSASSLPATTGNTLATVAFDFDGDGDVDVFLSKQQAPSRLWRNNGNGVFTDVSTNLPAAATDQLAAIAADFDNDGDVDLVLMSGYFSSAQDQVLVNQGGGLFTALPQAFGAGSTSIATADFDNDGDLDLAVGTNTGLHLHRNDGNLQFTDVTASWLATVATGNVLSVAFGDLDFDGDLDLVCGRQNVATDLILQNNGITFLAWSTLPSPGSGTKSIALFDCDGDGDLDIARAIISNSPALALNDGTGQWTDGAARLPAGIATFSARLLAVDLDRDADVDLLLIDEIPFFAATLLSNRHRDLVSGPAAIGQTWTIGVASEPGYGPRPRLTRLAIGTTRLASALALPGFGELQVDLDAPFASFAGVVPAVTGSTSFAFAVPPLPQLRGLPLHLQALIEQSRPLAQFTAYRQVVVQ